MNELHKALQDVSDRKAVLEETEKRAVREALIEERSRYCIFVTILKPVLVSSIYLFTVRKYNVLNLDCLFNCMIRKKKWPCLWNYLIYKKLWIN